MWSTYCSMFPYFITTQAHSCCSTSEHQSIPHFLSMCKFSFRARSLSSFHLLVSVAFYNGWWNTQVEVKGEERQALYSKQNLLSDPDTWSSYLPVSWKQPSSGTTSDDFSNPHLQVYAEIFLERLEIKLCPVLNLSYVYSRLQPSQTRTSSAPV